MSEPKMSEPKVGDITTRDGDTEEVVFVGYDEGWSRNLPVTLITYAEGTQDLHRQTGNQFDEHIAEARKILAARGLSVSPIEDIGGTGAYMRVTPDETAT